MKFKEVATPIYINVRELETPFEGTYLGKVEGKHGSNYLFTHEDKAFVVYGVKSVHEKMSSVDLGHLVRIAKVAEHRNQAGGVFVEVRVEVAEAPARLTEKQNS